MNISLVYEHIWYALRVTCLLLCIYLTNKLTKFKFSKLHE